MRSEALIDEIEVGRRIAGAVRVALQMADSVACAEEFETAGAERLGGPVDAHWHDRNVRLRAPDGIQLTLFTPIAEPR